MLIIVTYSTKYVQSTEKITETVVQDRNEADLHINLPEYRNLMIDI